MREADDKSRDWQTLILISVRRPEIIAPPPESMEVHVGRIFLLTCQARGVPSPRVQWYKDGAKVPTDNSRISVLLSGM